MPTSTATVKGIDASYYYVKDLNRATAFYTQLFGAEPTTHYPDTVSEWTFPGGESFGLYKPHDEEAFDTSGGILFAVEDIHARVTEAKTRGVHFDDGGKVEDTPVCYMAFGRDTEGNRFIFHERKA